MNAEEWKGVLAELSEVTDRVSKETGYTADVVALNRIRRTLDEHRLEMEAAQADKQPEAVGHLCVGCDAMVYDDQEALCPICHEKLHAESTTPIPIRSVQSNAARLDTIEKRLGEIADRQNRHLKVFHEVPDSAQATNAG